MHGVCVCVNHICGLLLLSFCDALRMCVASCVAFRVVHRFRVPGSCMCVCVMLDSSVALCLFVLGFSRFSTMLMMPMVCAALRYVFLHVMRWACIILRT